MISVLAFIERKPFETFLLLMGCMLFFIFKDFLFLRKLYLFADVAGDSINYSYPHFVHIAEYFNTIGIPKWSFHVGMGQNMYPLSIADPFTLTLYFTGKDGILGAIAYAEVVKIALIGILSFLYLRELNVTSFSNIIGSLLFTFCGYVLLHGGWYDVFSTHAVYVLFLLLSFEKLLKKGIWYLFPLAIALSASLSFFYLVLDCELLLIYSLFRYTEDSGRMLKGWLVFSSKQTMLGALGILMGSVCLFSGMLLLLESPRATGNMSESSSVLSDPIYTLESFDKICFYILRAFSTDIFGTSIDSPLKSNPLYLEAPVTYCGLISPILVPQIFHFLDKRKKIIYGLLLGGIIIVIIFPIFRRMFWLFTGDYCRVFAYFVVLILLYPTIQALSLIDKKSKINFPLLIITLVTIIIALHYNYSGNDIFRLIDKNLTKTITYFLLGYGVLLYFMTFQKWKPYAKLVLLIMVVVELSSFSNNTVNQRRTLTPSVLKQKVGYNDYTIEAVKYVNSIDKSFFRSARDYFSGFGGDGNLNTPQVQGYMGTSSYSSFNQPGYIAFMYAMGIDTNSFTASRSEGLNNKFILQTWASVKYYLIKNPQSIQTLRPMGYDSINQIGDVKIFKNRLALPLGFAYKKYITEEQFAKANFLQKNKILLNAFVIKNDEQEKYSGLLPVLTDSFPSTGISLEEYINPVKKLKQDTLALTNYTQNTIDGKIDLKEKKMLFFSIPFDKGWKATVNGQEAKLEKVNVGFMGLLLEKGTYDIQLEFEPPFVKLGLGVSIAAIFLYLYLFLKFRKVPFMPAQKIIEEKTLSSQKNIGIKKKRNRK